MTITINVSETAENRLKEEASRAGVTIPRLVERLVTERFDNAGDRIQKLFDDIAGPGYIADLSRESIYADD